MPTDPTTPPVPTPATAGEKLSLDLANVEIVERIEITDPEIVKRIRAIKEQGLEGIKISVETT